MRITRAAVFANRKKRQTAALKEEVELFLMEHGVKLSKKPQLVITIGGDGTVLYHKRHYGVPFFAIGSNTSFICQANFANWKGKLARALASLRVEKRLMLACSIDGKKMPLCLNEIGIRNPRPRVLSLHLEAGTGSIGAQKPTWARGSCAHAGGRSRHFAFRADGLLFCTPTGSAAYCYSCGGKQVKKRGSHYQAVAISPFRRIFRPLMLPKNTACILRLSGPERAQFFIDGQEFGGFSSKNTLRVWACRKPFLFAKA
jgi:NAD+ kinase